MIRDRDRNPFGSRLRLEILPEAFEQFACVIRHDIQHASMDNPTCAGIQVLLHIRHMMDTIVPALAQSRGMATANSGQPFAVLGGDADKVMDGPVPRGAKCPDVAWVSAA